MVPSVGSSSLTHFVYLFPVQTTAQSVSLTLSYETHVNLILVVNKLFVILVVVSFFATRIVTNILISIVSKLEQHYTKIIIPRKAIYVSH